MPPEGNYAIATTCVALEHAEAREVTSFGTFGPQPRTAKSEIRKSTIVVDP
jgi:hypothetical protein